MLFEITLMLTGIATTFFIAAILLQAINKSPVMPLVISGLLLLATGLIIASNGLQIQTGVPCIATTNETSQYWNCSILVENCSGTPEQNSCSAYDNQQCLDIPGCTWSGQCSGTPDWTCEQLYIYGGDEKCTETSGCTCNCTFEERECDSVDTTYTYTTCNNQYTNTTASPLNNSEYTMQITYYTLILGGLFLILWAATTATKKQEPE